MVIKAGVYLAEHLLRPSGVGISQRAATWKVLYAQMTELAALHHRCRGYFAKRIETHYHGVKLDSQVTPCVELLYIPLATVLAAYFNDFLIFKEI